ncbi:Flotillin-2 like [Heracleum sosnowskyi]|uniref:Flotillin-2 like n=1 Tax=Heracleum sosnowskyi TaxID=360622 RepID=A0AAD8N9B4_9APIA|nr:Flotillin-2 like [Heracleum sosnowskyi]
MKCIKHFATDLTSIDGVCSTCLTDRLIIVIQAQTKANLESKLAGKAHRNCTVSESESPEQICVSPSLSCNKVENGTTPQVVYKKVKKFSNFFRSKGSSDPDPNSSPWRMKSMLPKKKSCIFNSDASRVMQRPCKGMSPADDSDGELNSLDSTPQWKETPSRMTTPMHFRCKKMNQARNLTGFAFCLSPLVRPSPNRKTPENQNSGETRVQVKPHIGAASAFCANRSKKLANCGRFNRNY